MKKIKKSDLFLIGGVILVIVIAFFALGKETSKESIDLPVTIAGEPELTQLTYEDYQAKIDSKEPFILVIEKEGCSYCQMYMPILEEVASEKSVNINYMDLATLSEEEINDLTNSNSYLKRNNWGTPTTLLMVGDEVVDSISGYVEKEGVLEFLEKDVKLVSDTDE